MSNKDDLSNNGKETIYPRHYRRPDAAILSIQVNDSDLDELEALSAITGTKRSYLARALLRVAFAEVKKRKSLITQLQKIGETGYISGPRTNWK